jgi:hypothetical protein
MAVVILLAEGADLKRWDHMPYRCNKRLVWRKDGDMSEAAEDSLGAAGGICVAVAQVGGAADHTAVNGRTLREEILKKVLTDAASAHGNETFAFFGEMGLTSQQGRGKSRVGAFGSKTGSNILLQLSDAFSYARAEMGKDSIGGCEA